MWQARKRRRKALKMLIKAGRCSPSVLGREGSEEEEEGVAHSPGDRPLLVSPAPCPMARCPTVLAGLT